MKDAEAITRTRRHLFQEDASMFQNFASIVGEQTLLTNNRIPVCEHRTQDSSMPSLHLHSYTKTTPGPREIAKYSHSFIHSFFPVLLPLKWAAEDGK